ncbi:alpha/beta hydrolase [Clostridium tagluense]|uniref:alpha/beta hydrolase n=1 Tax=Clostridium tagluense TaxID=360422 RepID=UPI001CF21535|nr:alpha/beta hydrolase [Clostridium tagluense]MCB2314232.1 alpha/beta hydrolase [Clostridium tagluense]MCB2319097.1 alpha/beta hydrolase [Clostridium tagluense]MCB2323980.1 alpha/beta hydrolase [Clostridium tagluense]MCB2328828.1 alpha/beta hydrolase [Clostridium tagluense]MCB2333659.1 alpha/beta hydrolase [Clostridium tagluense]
MKKILIIILKAIGVIAIAIGLFLAIVFTVNIISNKSEQGKIQPYGQLVSVDGKNMNVTIQGQGKETVVLLPGYGTAAPALDFKPLVKALSPFYKVVVIEPFGYGLSDDTEKERSTENIVNETHEALQSLKIDRYILMGHSIAGIYGLDYVNKYQQEVSAFVGIDSSAPMQGGMDAEFPIETFKLLKKSGLARLVMKLSADPYAGLPFDDETKEQMRMITHKNLYNSSTSNEMKNLGTNFKAAKNLIFPKNLPVIFFVQANNTDVKRWIPLHEEQVKDSVHGKVVTFEGGHYLHHTKSKEIVENLRSFMKK